MSQQDTRWSNAIQEHDIPTVKRFLEEGWDINVSFPYCLLDGNLLRFNALLLALYMISIKPDYRGHDHRGHHEMIDFLLENGANPNSRVEFKDREGGQFEDALSFAVKIAVPLRTLEHFFEKGAIIHQTEKSANYLYSLLSINQLEIFLKYHANLVGYRLACGPIANNRLDRELVVFDKYKFDYDTFTRIDDVLEYLQEIRYSVPPRYVGYPSRFWGYSNKRFFALIHRLYTYKYVTKGMPLKYAKYVRFCVWMSSQTRVVCLDASQEIARALRTQLR